MVELFTWIVIFLFILQLALLSYLIIWKQNTLKRAEKSDQLSNRHRPAVLAYISGQDATLPEFSDEKLTPSVIEFLLDELSAKELSGEESERIEKIADFHLASAYRKSLKKGRWADRLNALYFIEDFRMTALREDCYDHFLKLTKQDEEFRQALRTCAMLQDDRLFENTSVLNAISSVLTKELLFRLDRKLLHRVLMKLLEDQALPETVLEGILVFSGEHKIDFAFPFVEQKLNDDRKEIRLKAMQSLNLYRKISDSDVLHHFFRSIEWEERMYAAKLAGTCQLEQFKDLLLETLADANWWVRYSSAESLAAFNEGNAILEDAAINHDDPYARDIARHILTQKGRNAS